MWTTISLSLGLAILGMAKVLIPSKREPVPGPGPDTLGWNATDSLGWDGTDEMGW